MSGSEPPIPPLTAETSLQGGAQEDSLEPISRLSTTGSRRSSYVKHSGLKSLGITLARRTLGISLLLVTVFLWTGSSFLASTIFADDTYSKPYFMTYFNTAFFVIPLVPVIIKRLYKTWRKGRRLSVRYVLSSSSTSPSRTGSIREEEQSFLKPDDENDDPGEHELRPISRRESVTEDGKLGFKETSKLSFEFCILWFTANYLAFACLQYTTVASTTILTSTSSIWTLIFGALVKVESFTLRKMLAVLASMAGIILISTVDMSGDNDKHRGTFPHKSQGEIAIGDLMALVSAILYGIYIIIMRKSVGNENRVNMPLFFGFIGAFNLVILWPGFFILHLTGIEKFGLPQTRRVWMIILINAVFSLVSDFCWAYAMLLTSPLVVTVGLSLTIPLSLVGQMILDSQFSSSTYWLGAGIVFLSFIVVNHESKQEQSQESEEGTADRRLLADASSLNR